MDKRLTEHQIIEVCSIISIIQNFNLGSGMDSLKWNINPSDLFMVKSCYANIKNKHITHNLHLSVWSMSWTHRIHFFLWLVFQKRLTTMDTFHRIGKLIVNVVCYAAKRESQILTCCSTALSRMKFGIILNW